MDPSQGPVDFLVPIAKQDRPRQIAFGVVLEPTTPDSPDLQDDWYSPDDIEKAAHGFLARVAAQKSVFDAGDVMHDEATLAGYPVESFIAPVDFILGDQPVAKGSWVIGMHYPDERIWKGIMDGTYAAFSVGGLGVREEG